MQALFLCLRTFPCYPSARFLHLPVVGQSALAASMPAFLKSKPSESGGMVLHVFLEDMAVRGRGAGARRAERITL